MPQGELRVFSGTGNPELAQEICQHLKIPLGQMQCLRFSNENLFVRIEENVRGADCFVVQSLSSPVNDHIMELLIALDAFWRASAGRVTAVIPYYAYGRTDKKDQPRVPITAKLMADLITTARAGRVLAMDLHAEQIQGFFSVPVDHLLAAPVLAKYVAAKKFRDVVLVAPDTGSAKRVRTVAKKLHLPIAIIDKRRIGNNDISEVLYVIGDVAGMTAVIFDDEIDTGGSVVNAAEALLKAGAKEVYAAVTHAVFSGTAPQRLNNSPIKEIIATNTLPIPAAKRFPKLTVLSVAELFASAIDGIHKESSITKLFEGF